MSVELLVLRLLHVGLGSLWVGAMLFNTLYVGPALNAAGPAAAGAVMGNMMQRKIMIVMPSLAILTILTGGRLMWIVSGGDSHWFQHRSGHTFAIAAALAIIGFLIGMFVARPTMMRMGELGRSAASDGASKEAIAAEMRRLQARAMRANQVVVALLLLALAGMAIARYV
jgi:hypothetical protein